MVWIGCLRCKKFRRDFVARTFEVIAPVWRVLHQVSCNSETISKSTRTKKMHQNMSLGPDGVDRVDLLEKNSNGTLWHELLH